MTPELEPLLIQSQCRHPECDKPMQWIIGYCDEHYAALKAVASQQDSQALHFSGQFQPDEGNKRTVYHAGRQQEGEGK